MKNTKEPNHSNIDCGRGTGKKLLLSDKTDGLSKISC